MDSPPPPAAGARPSVWAGAFVLIGLAGLAITQPVLDLMGRNPEFFVVGSYSSSQIIWFGLIVALVPSAVLIVVYALSRLAHPRLGWWVLVLMVAGLGAVFGNVLVRGVGLDNALVALVAAAAGAVAAVLLVRSRAGRLLLEYLAVANVLFLIAFLFMSPVSALVSDDSAAGDLGMVSVPEPPGPVVVIVFDELPLPTLMTTEGKINAERFPAFARLAETSTWYRNTSSSYSRTERAVPAIVTGTALRERTMPTYQELPRNLLALMGKSVPVRRYESTTDLCPRDTCEARAGKPLSRALGDSLVVYGHRVLPRALREDLSPIDDAWGDFGGGIGEGRAVDTGGPTEAVTSEAPVADADPLARWRAYDKDERSPAAQAARLAEEGLAIDGGPSLHFIHVVLPHAPWSITPWGTTVMPPVPKWDDANHGDDVEWSGLERFQRHSLQTGAADVALGQVLGHLEASGAWDDATLLVTADHGTSTIPPDVGRNVTENNAEEVHRVPFFLKAPGQQEPTVVDVVANTVDELPTLMDVLDIETNWEMDGHSLLDGSEPTIEPVVDTDVAALFEVVQRHATDFPHGWSWTALAAVGEHGELVGTPLRDLVVGEPSRLGWVPDNENTFGALPTETGATPQFVTGMVAGTGDDEPPPLVIVANGTVAGVTGGYDPADGGWTFSSMLGPYLVDGANDIQAYEVTEADGGPTLHRLG